MYEVVIAVKVKYLYRISFMLSKKE